MKWKYESNSSKSNGYEDVLDELKNYNKEMFLKLSKDEQNKTINEVFEIYRSKNIFPIQYFNSDGISEEINKCIDKEVSFDGDVLNLRFNQGSAVCRFLFPNLAMVNCKGVIGNSPFEKFHDDNKLKKAISFCLTYKNSNCPVTPSGIKDGLEMLGGNVATNFKPMNAKALYEEYCPENGIIYDFASGFGGRMLGALSSKKNFKYFGVEPCEDTFNGLQTLGKHIEETTGREQIFRVFKEGSEDFMPEQMRGKVDFAFSSPPYFNLEVYSDADTQCYIKFPTLEEWFDGYVRPTIQNIYDLLKDGGKYAVNIADFKVGSQRVEYVDRWVKISEEIGFTFDKQIFMKLQTRRGNGHDESNKTTKQEGIFVFVK